MNDSSISNISVGYKTPHKPERKRWIDDVKEDLHQRRTSVQFHRQQPTGENGRIKEKEGIHGRQINCETLKNDTLPCLL